MNLNVYIDGFNLFHGLQASGLKNCYWLDPVKVVSKVAASLGFEIKTARYFTARLPHHHQSAAKQRIWLEALNCLRPSISLHFGDFREESIPCNHCCNYLQYQREKKSDVNLAAYVLRDYVKNRADGVMLVTGDSDQEPTVRALKAIDNQYPVYVLFPPARTSRDLQVAVGRDCSIELKQELILTCLLPQRMADGVSQPHDWN